jgi:hypothetical protein
MYKAIDTAMSKAEGRLKDSMSIKKRKRNILKKMVNDGKGGFFDKSKASPKEIGLAGQATKVGSVPLQGIRQLPTKPKGGAIGKAAEYAEFLTKQKPGNKWGGKITPKKPATPPYRFF